MTVQPFCACPPPVHRPGQCPPQPFTFEREHLASCIWIDPARQSGAPCFGGTRIPITTVASLPDEAIRDWYPGVTEEHIATLRWWLTQPGVKRLLKEWR